jgi:hypothetical protein
LHGGGGAAGAAALEPELFAADLDLSLAADAEGAGDDDAAAAADDDVELSDPAESFFGQPSVGIAAAATPRSKRP